MTGSGNEMLRLSRLIQPALAVLILLVAVFLAGQSRAETLTVGLSATAPNIGKVAAGAAATNFTVAASSGSVTIGAGGAQFVPYTATRTALTTVTINCSGGSKCSTNNITVTIAATSATGRLGTISAWSADFTGGATARLSNNATSASSASSTMTLTLKPVVTSGTTGSANFHLGMTLPVNISGGLGGATSGYSVIASGTGYTTSPTATAAAQSAVEGKLTMAKTSDLQYGTVVLIAGQSGTITWDAATQTLSTNPGAGLVVQKGTTSIATFTVSGTPGQTLHFSLAGNAGLPNNITLTNGQGFTLNITPSSTGQSSQSIPGGGTFTFYLGGTISISPTMHTGAYSGGITVTANYE
jgi:hypothetical protein